MKSNKSWNKRIKVTKTGKILREGIGKGHNLSKESRTKQLKRRTKKVMSLPKQTTRRFLPKR